MNTNSKFFIPAFAGVVLIIVLVILAIQGGASVPKDAVATVDGQSIPITRFDQVLRIFSAQSQPNAKGAIVVPDPPDFKKCIANKIANPPVGPKGKAAKKPTPDQAKKTCEQEWSTAKQQIMTSLLQNKWYELEAKDRNIEITQAQVMQRFLPLKQQTFPKPEQYQQFLKKSGQTEQDLLNLVRNQMYQEKIRTQVTSNKPPTAQDVTDYYNQNKSKFLQPASRDLQVVFTAKKPKAEAAAAALKGGQSWDAVAKQYSEDKATKNSGGKFPGVTKGQFEPSLDKAIFSADKGVITGPVKTQFGYYVFVVDKATPAKQQTEQQAAAQIKQTLQQNAQSGGFEKFQTEFQKKWRAKTLCAKLYVMDMCKNGPKPANTAATGAGGAPAGG